MKLNKSQPKAALKKCDELAISLGSLICNYFISSTVCSLLYLREKEQWLVSLNLGRPSNQLVVSPQPF